MFFVVRRESKPLRPNGLEIAYVTVKGEPLLERRTVNLFSHLNETEFPQFSSDANESKSDDVLSSFNSSNSNLDNEFSRFNFSSLFDIDEFQSKSQFLMVVSEFVVTYVARNCGKGLDPIQGVYENSSTLLSEDVPIHNISSPQEVYAEKVRN